jgi:EPS-associated MarR family transcriptional regulator
VRHPITAKLHPPSRAPFKVQRHGGSVLKALYRPANCPFGKPPFHPVPSATAPARSPRITRLQEEMRFNVLHALQQQPDMNQRQLAELLGVSLGKTNYLLRALVDKGLLKARNFRNSQNKLAYAYLLTPSGIAQKAELTRGYLERKTAEYEALKDEIDRLKAELTSGH